MELSRKWLPYLFKTLNPLSTGDNLETLQTCEHEVTETISTPFSLGQQSLVATKLFGEEETQVRIGALCDSNQESALCAPRDSPRHHGITRYYNLLFMQNICWSRGFNHSLLQCMWTLPAPLEEARDRLLSGFPGIPTWDPESSSH